MSSLLRGKASIKPALISSSINRCFSSLRTTPPGVTTAPWLMMPPTLLAKHDHCHHCKFTLNRSGDPNVIFPTFNFRRSSEVKPDDNNYYHFFNVADNKLSFKKKKRSIRLPWNNDNFSPDESKCIGSSHGWLAFIHPRNCILYLYNPFSSSSSSMPYLPLPPIETLPPIVSSKRLNATHIHNSSSSSSIVTEFTIKKSWGKEIRISGKELSEKLFKKVAMSGVPSDECTDCTVMAIYNDYQCPDEGKLAFCRIGDSSWTELAHSSFNYSDIVYLSKDNHFYAVCSHRSCDEGGLNYREIIVEDCLVCWDLADPSSPNRYCLAPISNDQCKKRGGCRRAFYLVESSSGELLTVVRYYKEDSHNKEDLPKNFKFTEKKKESHNKFVTTAFDVFKLEHSCHWTYVPNNEDHILFVSRFQSVCLSAHDFPGLRKNCIYFTAHDQDNRPNQSREFGVYNLEEDRVEESFDLEWMEPSPFWVVPHH